MRCELCNKDFKSYGGLHLHVKKIHLITQEEYYHTFNPRYDKYSHDLICYKSLDQYLKTDFNSRENFIEWFSENIKNPYTKEYCLNKLKERAERKQYFTCPSQVELKSMMVPSLLGFEKLYGTLDLFFSKLREIGISPKFRYGVDLDIDLKSPLEIYIDSREQLPLQFSCLTRVIKVPCGDYFPNESFFSNVFVERKSCADLAGTLGNGLDRFVKELEKAKSMGFYIVVVVEDLYSNVLNYVSTNRYSKKMTGSHIFHAIRDLSSRFDVQFMFAGNRSRSVEIIEKIFRLRDQAKLLDLEFLRDKQII